VIYISILINIWFSHEEIKKAVKHIVLSGKPPEEEDDQVEIDPPNYSVASLFDKVEEEVEDEGKSYGQIAKYVSLFHIIIIGAILL
jgi:hypothetical protein